MRLPLQITFRQVEAPTRRRGPDTRTCRGARQVLRPDHVLPCGRRASTSAPSSGQFVPGPPRYHDTRARDSGRTRVEAWARASSRPPAAVKFISTATASRAGVRQADSVARGAFCRTAFRKRQEPAGEHRIAHW